MCECICTCTLRSLCKLELAKFRSHHRPASLAVLLPTNHGFRRLFSTVKLRKYSSKPLTGFAWGWTDRVPSTSGSLPLLTNPLALQPSLPIQEKTPVALRRLTALMTPATSWSEPKIMQPAAIQVERISRGNFACKVARRSFISFLILIIVLKESSLSDFILSHGLLVSQKFVFPKGEGFELLLKKCQ